MSRKKHKQILIKLRNLIPLLLRGIVLMKTITERGPRNLLCDSLQPFSNSACYSAAEARSLICSAPQKGPWSFVQLLGLFYFYCLLTLRLVTATLTLPLVQHTSRLWAL